MAFMIPEYTREPFLVGENQHGEGDSCPLSAWMSHADIRRNDPDALRKAMDLYAADRDLQADTVEIIHDKWWARLSAPGYMDATDWLGPYDTRDAARDAIADMYDVDPDTGDELEYL